MPIPINPQNDAFLVFPYPANGAGNAGGIDLVDEPHRIEEIQEAASVPALKRLLVEVNSPNGHLMTLGCEAGPQEGAYYGYVEFAFRDLERVKHPEEYEQLYEGFLAWTASRHSQEVAEQLRAAVLPEMARHLYPAKNADGWRLALFLAAENQHSAESILDEIRTFLVEAESDPTN
jgi:hypothetical protein